MCVRIESGFDINVPLNKRAPTTGVRMGNLGAMMIVPRQLKATVSLFALSLAASAPAAFAQPADAPAEADNAPIEKVVVTGSRIPRPNLEQPTPVTTVQRERIENAGTSNLGDIVAQFPALSSNGTVRANSDSFGDAGGLNFPDLRSLGTARTL